jgi:hypothetical protein
MNVNVNVAPWCYFYDYLSPEKRAEIDDFFAALEIDPPNECPNCMGVIGDHESFCGDDCREEYMSLVDSPSNPCPQQTGAGMGFIGGSK